MVDNSHRNGPSDPTLREQLVFAGLAGTTGVAGSYAVAGYSRDFVVAPIDAFVINATPGPVIVWMIETVGEPAHLLHIALSFVVAIGLFGIASLLGTGSAYRFERPLVGVGIAGSLSWIVTTAITSEPVLALGTAVPVAVFTAINIASVVTSKHDASRRSLLKSGASALGFLGVSLGVGRFPRADSSDLHEADWEDDIVEGYLQRAEEKSLDLGEEGPGLVSSIDEFYNVDIREFDPEIPTDEWSLDILGQISGAEITITFDDLTERPIEHRYMTLRCVGDRLNGEQMDTAVWTGTPIKPFIDEVDPNGDCGCAMLRAEDGYYVEFPVDALEDGFLAWRMNGRPLPKAHGFPVRVLVPGRWGETNVKWLNEIEVLEEETEGYWEKRGWEGTGPVHTVAKLHVINDLDDGRKQLGGHAYAGTRGIREVEVSTDAGRTWNEATLSEPLEGNDVWRQWEYRYEPPDETHIAVVRAIDGNGDVQPRGDSSESSNTFSTSGATGWVTQTID